MSYRTLSTKPLNASLKTLMKRGAHIGIGLGAFTPVLALANPTGGQVMGGQATIANPSANGTIITQKSQSAIINWQQFNIGSGQFVQFLQPSSSSVVLNRVIGGSASSILGSLTANGQVFLVNTNGVYFGKGASVDTQGFLASTLGITDQNFLSHNYVFDQAGAAGATVINQGSITSHHAGYVVLAGDYAENDGIISAQSGHVVLASGAKATLALNGNNLVNFAVNQSTLATYAGVKNAGSVLADGGTVIMTADVANLLKATVVNNTGLVEARAISDKGGVISLTATGGDIQNAGTLDVSATRNGQAGGDITLKGDGLTRLTNTSNIDAAGQGGNGGSVEVSGNTIAMRGAMKIGKGGKLLMDPGEMQIVLGTASSSLNSPGSATNTGSVGHVGVNYIQNQLNQGVGVTIQATHLIDASTHVHTITATTLKAPATQEGDLTLKTTGGPGSRINLSGVDINIGGKLTASMGYGTFGQLTAGSMNLTATGAIDLERASASVHGVISKYSAKTTTGALTITADSVSAHGSAEDGIALQAKTSLQLNADIGESSAKFGSDVTLMGAAVLDTKSVFTNRAFTANASAGAESLGAVVANTGATLTDKGGNLTLGSVVVQSGKVTITDTAGNLDFTGSATKASGDSGLTITAKHILDGGAGTLTLEAGEGDVTLNGILGATTAAGLGHVLDLHGDVISVNNNVKASSLSITGGHLAYTGKNTTFALSASAGNMVLDASIGSVAAPVKYNVSLTDKGHDVDIQRSIFTGNTAGGAAANITATQTFSSAVSGQRGVHVGNSDSTAITLSAKGSVTLTGANVLIGQLSPSSSQGPITISARNITLTANGPHNTSGHVRVVAGKASASSGLLDRSVTLNAIGSITMTGRRVDILGGAASANLNASASYASDLADVTLSARGNVTLKGAASASGSVDVVGGNVGAHASNLHSGSSHVDVEANVSITAGQAISLTAENIQVSGGYASQGIFAKASHSGADVTVAASAKTTLSAGTTVTITGGSNNNGHVTLSVGSDAGEHAEAHADGSSAKAMVTVDTSLDVTAGSAIIVGGHEVDVLAGYKAGNVQASPHRNVTASGSGASAFVGITANVELNAGAGGIILTGKGGSDGLVMLQGGDEAGVEQNAFAQSGGKALSSVQARVDLITTGNVKLIATGDIVVTAGDSGASRAVASASVGNASIKTDAGVSLSGHSVTASAGGSLLIGARGAASYSHDGYGAYQAIVSAGSNGVASVDSEANIAITATQGTITLRGVRNVRLEAGYGLAAGSVDYSGTRSSSHTTASGATSHNIFTDILNGAQANAFGSGAQATLKASAGVSLTATGAINVIQTGNVGEVELVGGATAGYGALPTAFDGGHASIDLQEGVSLVAGGAVTLTGIEVRILGGVAGGANAPSSHVHHYLQRCASISSCGAEYSSGNYFAPHEAIASGTGAVSQFDTDGSIVVKGSSITMTGRNTGTDSVDILGGVFAGSRSRLQANSHGSVSEDHEASVDLTATGAITITAGQLGSVSIAAGFDAGYGVVAAASYGGGGVAKSQVDSGVYINASTMTLQAGEAIHLYGGNDAGYGAVADAVDAKAAVTADAALKITLVNAFSATLTGSSTGGSIALEAAGNAGHSAGAFAFTGQASVGADASLNLTSTRGTITLDTGKHANGAVYIGASESDGAFIEEQAYGHNATATVTATADADLSTVSTIRVHADGSINIFAGSEYQVYGAEIGAGSGGKAKVDVSGDANISGGNVSLTAGGSANIHGGGYDIGAEIDATPMASGSASLISETDVNLTASGVLSITAGTYLNVLAAGAGHGRNVTVGIGSSGKNAKSTVDIESNITLSGNTGVSLVAKGDLTVAGESSSSSGRAGYEATVFAGSHDTATLTDNENVSIVSKGTFSAVGADVGLFGGSEVGYGAVVDASGAGAKATLNASGAVDVSAAAVRLSATKTILVEGGDHAGAGLSSSASDIFARNGGNATLGAAAGVSITAANAFSAILTGTSHSSGGISIQGGRGAGYSDDLQAYANGHANLNASAGVDINVTGKGGTLILNAGKVDGSFYVRGGSSVGEDLRASAGSGGAIAAAASGGVKLSALGAVELLGVNSDLYIQAGSSVARRANVSASHAAHATLTAGAEVDITGASVTVMDAAVGIGAGQYDGASGMYIHAEDGGSANANADANLNIQALTGAINVSATAGYLYIVAASEAVGRFLSAGASGGNAMATATLTNSVSLAAATNIALAAKSDLVVMAGGSSERNGRDAGAFASHGGKATADESMYVSITAGGAFTARAGGHLKLIGGGDSSLGLNVYAYARGGRANASLTEDATLSVTAKSITASGNSVSISAGNKVGQSASVFASNGAAAALNLKAGTSLVATGGNISIKGKQRLVLRAGDRGGSVSTVTTFSHNHLSGTSGGGYYRTYSSGLSFLPVARASGNNASAKYNLDASVSLTATGAITLSQTDTTSGAVSISAGRSVGARARTSADGGQASFNAAANVNLSAGGAVSIKGFNVRVNGGSNIGVGGGRTPYHGTISACTVSGACTSLGTESGLRGNPVFAQGVNSKALVNDSAAVNISGATVTLTAANDMSLRAGHGDASGASVVAQQSGSAAMTVQTGIKVTTPGTFVATAGNFMFISANGSSSAAGVGAGAVVDASGGGAYASLTAANDIQIVAKSVAVTATHGDLYISGGYFVGDGIRLHANSSSDQAVASLSAKVDITAATTLSLTGASVELSGGGWNAASADLSAQHSSGAGPYPTAAPFASVSLDADASVNLAAGGNLTVKAATYFDAQGGYRDASSAQVYAYGSSASAKLDSKADVNFTAANFTVVAGYVGLGAGSQAGKNAKVETGHGARGEIDLEAGVNVTATGGVAITATRGDVDVSGGYGSFISGAPLASASNGGTATFNEQLGASITAGTTLSITAGSDVSVAGGSRLFGSAVATLGYMNKGSSTSPASHAGVVNMTISGVAALNAGTTLNLTAKGSLQVVGGSENGMAINLFPIHQHSSHGTISAGPAGGVANGQLTAGVSLTAGGDVNLRAGRDLTVAAGAGVDLAVGMTRVNVFSSGGATVTSSQGAPVQAFLGDGWGGGSANLTADVSAVVTAGHNLSLTAGAGGSGNLQVEGLRPDHASYSNQYKIFNVAAVRGGSSDANAVVSLTGNATLNAGNDIIINARGNASIVGGSLATLRADHTRGYVTITGSADATLHAGHDVVLNNITGSLTVAGVNVNSSHTGAVFVDAFGSTGHAVVTGHADAAISAGNDVRTVAAIGKNFNVVAGNYVVAYAGGSSGSVLNDATATADAGVIAGGSVVVNAKGDLNVLGGEYGRAYASATGHSTSNSHGSPSSGHHFGSRIAKLSATAGIAAGGALAINAAGSAVIAAGDGLETVAKFKFEGSTPSAFPALLGVFGNAQASGDVGAGITASTTFNLTVGKSLLVRGGSGDAASASAFFVASSKVRATTDANVSLVSGGVMTITTTHGDASFVAGSIGAAKTVLYFGFSASAQAVDNVDATVQTGGNLTLNVGRNLVVAGGPVTEFGSSNSHGFESGAIAVGRSATAKTSVTAHATFTVGGNLTATLHGGDVTIEAGGSVAALRTVEAGGFPSASADNASLTADAGVTLHAGGAIKLTGAGSVGIFAGPLFPFGSASPALDLSSTGGPIHVSTVSSVKISGKGVNINGGKNVGSPVSFGTFSGSGVKMDGTITITSTAGVPVLSVSPLTVRAPQSVQGGVSVAPMSTTNGFGGARTMSFMPTADATGSAPLWSVPVSTTSGAVHTTSQTLSLDTLQSQALVMSLVTLVVTPGDAAPLAATPQTTLFSPEDLTAGFANPFPASCGALLLTQQSCKVGGR